MKLLRLLPTLFLVGCTTLNVQKGTYYTNADNQDVKIDARNGQITHYEAHVNDHSSPIRSYGSVLGTGLMGAAMLGATHGATGLIR